MAKGIGNGCPLGAVVTTPKIAAALAQRIHFNTFGGNPVVCAQGKAVLEVIEREELQANALKMGKRIFLGLQNLKEKHNIIGDVRGKGLLLGIELVKDRGTKEPAKSECAQVFEPLPRSRLVVRQRRTAWANDSILAANVHPSGGRRFSSRGARSGAESALAEESPWPLPQL